MIQEEQPVKITIQDLIYSHVKDLGKRMDRLENRMDKLEMRIEKLSERMDKQDEKIDRLADKIDELRRDLTGGTNHNQVMIGSIVAIALGVLYQARRKTPSFSYGDISRSS